MNYGWLAKILLVSSRDAGTVLHALPLHWGRALAVRAYWRGVTQDWRRLCRSPRSSLWPLVLSLLSPLVRSLSLSPSLWSQSRNILANSKAYMADRAPAFSGARL